MNDSLHLYGHYLSVSLRGQMQYRASFLLWSFGQFVAIGIEFLGIWALFDRFGNLRGWTLAEIALLYGIVHIAFALAEGIGRGFDRFSDVVRAGDFDRILLRPRATALQIAGGQCELSRIGRLLCGLLALFWAASQLEIAWTLPKILLLLFAIVGGFCVFYGLFVLQATLCFWTVESLEVMNTVTYGGTETAQFPLTIYRPWLRLFFTFVVPLACMNYLPAAAILERPGVPVWLQWTAPLIGVLFLVVSLRLWNFGVRHYRSTGS